MIAEEPECAPEYETGPFCAHWSDPYDCYEMCACGHECRLHSTSAECRPCNVGGCECDWFVDES